MSDAPSLGQLVWLVRRELEWARQVDAEHPLRFEVGDVELEATLEVSRTTTKGGGLDLTVLGVGGKGELSQDRGRGTTATVKVTLTPSDPRTPGAKYRISAADTEPPPRRAEAPDGEPLPPSRTAAAATTAPDSADQP